MPYAPEVDGQAGLPFSGVTPLSRLASYDGARAAQSGAKDQRQRIYDLLFLHGPMTDHEISEALRMLRSTVCARRNELLDEGRVMACGLKPGPFRIRNTEWGAIVR
jgi:hypothetical protein